MASTAPDSSRENTMDATARDEWINTHCYGCGELLVTPLDRITDENGQTANAEHEGCFR